MEIIGLQNPHGEFQMTMVTDVTQEMITELYLDADMVDLSGNVVTLYALDAKTIGLSSSPPKKWLEQALWKQEVQVLQDGDEYTIILPPELIRFYQPKKVELAGEIDRKTVILVIHQ